MQVKLSRELEVFHATGLVIVFAADDQMSSRADSALPRMLPTDGMVCNTMQSTDQHQRCSSVGTQVESKPLTAVTESQRQAQDHCCCSGCKADAKRELVLLLFLSGSNHSSTISTNAER